MGGGEGVREVERGIAWQPACYDSDYYATLTPPLPGSGHFADFVRDRIEQEARSAMADASRAISAAEQHGSSICCRPASHVDIIAKFRVQDPDFSSSEIVEEQTRSIEVCPSERYCRPGHTIIPEKRTGNNAIHAGLILFNMAGWEFTERFDWHFKIFVAEAGAEPGRYPKIAYETFPLKDLSFADGEVHAFGSGGCEPVDGGWDCGVSGFSHNPCYTMQVFHVELPYSGSPTLEEMILSRRWIAWAKKTGFSAL